VIFYSTWENENNQVGGEKTVSLVAAHGLVLRTNSGVRGLPRDAISKNLNENNAS